MEQYEEISLKDLILLLVRGWKILILSIVVIMVIALGVFILGNQETYSLSSKATLSYNESHMTVYGNFDVGLNKAIDVLAFIQDDYYEDLQDVTFYEFPVKDLKPYIRFIAIEPDKVTITYSGLDRISLHNLQSNVNRTLSNYLSHRLKDNAKRHFLVELSNAMQQESYDLIKNEELIILLEAELAATNILMNNNIINPSYVVIATKIQDLKISNIELNYALNLASNQMKMLETSGYEDTLSSIVINVDTVDETTVTIHQRFNNNTFFPISFVLGLIIGVLIVLLKNYWKNSK